MILGKVVEEVIENFGASKKQRNLRKSYNKMRLAAGMLGSINYDSGSIVRKVSLHIMIVEEEKDLFREVLDLYENLSVTIVCYHHQLCTSADSHRGTL